LSVSLWHPNRFPPKRLTMNWMPDGPEDYVLAAQGVGVDPAYIPRPMEKVAEASLTTNADYLDVTGLDINAHGGLYFVWCYLKSLYTTTAPAKLYLEGVLTDTDYYTQHLRAYNTTVDAAQYNNPNFLVLPPTTGIRSLFWIVRTDDGDVVVYTPYVSPDDGAGITLIFRYLSPAVSLANVTTFRIQHGVTGNYLGAGSFVKVYRFV